MKLRAGKLSLMKPRKALNGQTGASGGGGKRSAIAAWFLSVILRMLLVGGASMLTAKVPW